MTHPVLVTGSAGRVGGVGGLVVGARSGAACPSTPWCGARTSAEPAVYGIRLPIRTVKVQLLPLRPLPYNRTDFLSEHLPLQSPTLVRMRRSTPRRSRKRGAMSKNDISLSLADREMVERRSKDSLGPRTDATNELHGATHPATRFVFVEDRVMYGRVNPTVLGAAVLILLAGLPALRTRADDKGHEAHAAHFDHCARRVPSACANASRASITASIWSPTARRTT